MHVIWERRRITSGRRDEGFLLEALLVRTVNGQGFPQEGIVSTLGSIEERFLKVNESGIRAFHQGIFWSVADKKLEELKLAEEVRKEIEKEILEVVERPGPDWSLWCVKCIPRYDDG
ncbi:MAG: hypothetical protein JRJ03_14400 [Deltaproteobacteria bacterium]|nr:hypothetical protein [Deltaproteobacteria bacterium]